MCIRTIRYSWRTFLLNTQYIYIHNYVSINALLDMLFSHFRSHIIVYIYIYIYIYNLCINYIYIYYIYI